jgi:hypothetical protein
VAPSRMPSAEGVAVLCSSRGAAVVNGPRPSRCWCWFFAARATYTSVWHPAVVHHPRTQGHEYAAAEHKQQAKKNRHLRGGGCAGGGIGIRRCALPAHRLRARALAARRQKLRLRAGAGSGVCARPPSRAAHPCETALRGMD